MTTITIEMLPGVVRIEARQHDERGSPPQTFDAQGEEVPESRPGLVKCRDCNVVALRRSA
jgi:hypothetical protein